jgi:hypothetical protein
MLKRKGTYQPLTDRQVEIIRDAHARGLTQAQAAFLAGVGIHTIYARQADQLVGLDFGHGRGARGDGTDDPTEDEIETMKALIRARNGHPVPAETSKDRPARAG